MPEENQNPLLVASYERQEGTARYAPYVNCSVSALMGRKQPERVVFKARIDTGADVTCIPRGYAKPFMPLQPGKTVLTREYAGKVRRVRLMMLMVSIHFADGDYEIFRPSDGVILTKSDIGMIGMDIISRLDMRMNNEKLYIYPLSR
jgi:hypothetical protein